MHPRKDQTYGLRWGFGRGNVPSASDPPNSDAFPGSVLNRTKKGSRPCSVSCLGAADGRKQDRLAPIVTRDEVSHVAKVANVGKYVTLPALGACIGP
jgi:hypothetical protein